LGRIAIKLNLVRDSRKAQIVKKVVDFVRLFLYSHGMKFSNPESRRLVKSAAAHRRLARAGQRRFRDALRVGSLVSDPVCELLVKHIDANLRCAAMDFAMAREMEAK
jgi:hypothetical protein